MVIACWILKDQNTLRICNIYCLSTAIMVTAKQLNFTLYEQYIVCLFHILFASYHLFLITFLNHLLSFSGIQRHVNFYTCILLDTNLQDFWRYVIWRLHYISVTVSQVGETDGWVLSTVIYIYIYIYMLEVWYES